MSTKISKKVVRKLLRAAGHVCNFILEGVFFVGTVVAAIAAALFMIPAVPIITAKERLEYWLDETDISSDSESFN